MVWALSLTLVGILLLFGGADFFVRSSIAIASRLGLSPIVIGLTIVAAATSMPEALTCVLAQLHPKENALAVGTVIGSNIANLGLILGLSLLLSSCKIPRDIKTREMPLQIIMVFLIYVIAVTGSLGRLGAAALLVLLIAYQIYQLRKQKDFALGEHAKPLKWPYLIFFVGLALMLGGGELLVKGALILATHFGVSDAVIGLTIVAVGTSLPELATVIAAAIHKKEELVLGNVLGSNIFNSLFILPLSAFVKPLVIPAKFTLFDLPVMFGFTALLFVFVLLRKNLGRIEGSILLLGYGGYIFFQYNP